MTIAVLGLNHKSSRLELREAIQRNLEAFGNVHGALQRAAGCEELLVLSTCNRIEVYFSTSRFDSTVGEIEKFLLTGLADAAGEFRNSFYLFQEEDAVRHCFTVAPGLDSMILGEPEILGQMKQAFKTAQETGTLNGPLMRLFEKAFQAAKEVRTQTDIGKGALGTASVSMALAQKVCGSLSDKSILIVGGGKFGEKLIGHLVKSGCRHIAVSSRRSVRGQELADHYSIRAIPFAQWKQHLEAADLFISAITQPDILLDSAQLRRIMALRKKKTLCLLDLAVPRSVDPEVSKIDGVSVFNIEDLKGIGYQNLKVRENAMAQAYAIIHARTKTFLMGLRMGNLSALVPQLNELVRESVQSEVWPALKPHLLTEEERRSVESAVGQMESNLSRNLLLRLKSLIAVEETSSADSLLAKLFQDEFSGFNLPDTLKKYPVDFPRRLRSAFIKRRPLLHHPKG